MEVATCLVVDDEADQRTLTRMVVQGTGRFTRIWEAQDGLEAIALASAKQPHLVLLDLAMPVMDGLHALPRLRTASPSSLLIVCSMVQDVERLHAAKMAGAHGFIDKSLPIGRFGAAIEALALQPRRVRASWPEPVFA